MEEMLKEMLDDFDKSFRTFHFQPNFQPNFQSYNQGSLSPRDEMLSKPEGRTFENQEMPGIIPNTKQDIILDDQKNAYTGFFTPFGGTLPSQFNNDKQSRSSFHTHTRIFTREFERKPDGTEFEKSFEEIDGKRQTKTIYKYPDGTIKTEIIENNIPPITDNKNNNLDQNIESAEKLQEDRSGWFSRFWRS